jgi:hypothetical protein
MPVLNGDGDDLAAVTGPSSMFRPADMIQPLARPLVGHPQRSRP